MLRDEYLLNSELFKELSKKDVLRIQQMQIAYRTGKFCLFESNIETLTDSLFPETGESDKKHSDLVQAIYLHKEQTLEPFVGPIDDLCPEYPVLFGKIDIMAISGRISHVIEVKTDAADHSIVGQVMKYYIGLSLKLIQKFWDEVQIVTICPGYEKSAYHGLRQINAKPLLIDTRTLKVTLLG